MFSAFSDGCPEPVLATIVFFLYKKFMLLLTVNKTAFLNNHFRTVHGKVLLSICRATHGQSSHLCDPAHHPRGNQSQAGGSACNSPPCPPGSRSLSRHRHADRFRSRVSMGSALRCRSRGATVARHAEQTRNEGRSRAGSVESIIGKQSPVRA